MVLRHRNVLLRLPNLGMLPLGQECGLTATAHSPSHALHTITQRAANRENARAYQPPTSERKISYVATVQLRLADLELAHLAQHHCSAAVLCAVLFLLVALPVYVCVQY